MSRATALSSRRRATEFYLEKEKCCERPKSYPTFADYSSVQCSAYATARLEDNVESECLCVAMSFVSCPKMRISSIDRMAARENDSLCGERIVLRRASLQYLP